MTSPAQGLTIPDNAGTDPGMVCSHKNPKIPNMARRPLLISEIKPRALASADRFLLKPNGSYKFRGTGWGMPSNVGYFPGLPPFHFCTHGTRNVRQFPNRAKKIHMKINVKLLRNNARTFRVVCFTIAIQFRVPFQESNEQDDLNLGGKGKSVPLFGWRKIRRWVWKTTSGQGPWEYKIGLYTIPNKCSHCYTPVLDFGLTQPTNSSCFIKSPISSIDQTQRIPVSHNGIELLGNILQVSLVSKVETNY